MAAAAANVDAEPGLRQPLHGSRSAAVLHACSAIDSRSAKTSVCAGSIGTPDAGSVRSQA